MSNGRLKVVRVMANPKRKKPGRRKTKKRKPAKLAPNPKAREMIVAYCRRSTVRSMDHYEYWSGKGWEQQKAKGKKYRWREDLNAAFNAARKKPPMRCAAVLTIPA